MNTKIISLRSFTPNDQTMLLEILTSPKVNKTYMLPDFEQTEDAIPLFRRLTEMSENEARFVRCIDLDGTAIGFLNDVEIKDNAMEVGYVIHPDYHNRGFMTAALTLAIQELFRKGYSEVICGAFEGNDPSLRVMEKCGMKRMSHTDTIEYRGQSHNCIYYHSQK